MITSIARRRTFTELRRDGRRARSGAVRLSYLPLETERPQVAFAIGRSFGTAVERNRGRRRLRAAFIEAAFSPEQPSALSTGSVENEVEGGPRTLIEASGLNGAFLLTGNRGLLTNRYADLVRDVDNCLEKLKATVVS